MPRIRPKLYLLFAPLLAGTLLLGACAGDDEGGNGDNGDNGGGEPAATEEGGGEQEAASIAVALDDFSVDPAESSASAGEVTFEVLNEGATPHELAIVRSDEAVDALPVEGGVVDESAVDVVDRTDNVESGQSESLTVDLEAGRYILICNIPGHYDLGMRTEFTVE